ncbi:carboxylic ester hydrolase [Leifsonia sp. LS1]|uniref:carboxylesterase/lipase family protein n=1 Tax=Leifsonia sp. LS1 TaxID=2828483 RepID=UPI001CFC8D8E|nr:carboxylesterase family protein [Leifsonia sp. LS1]GIT79567.1 carboxylic ester hydrolase [Leifsonia sp. LS1]
MSNPTPPVVPTASGRVAGVWRHGSAAFLGIPFAEAPVGDLRFAAPVPHAPWDGVRDASAYGPTPQRVALAEVTAIPEPSIPGDSTLNVNVFTPAPGDTAAKLPVLVYIHGGGFVAGSPASPWYDGRAFNRDGVVTVSVSYRLGFDGFGWIEDAPANRAVLDWLLALEWVRDNVARFGGDPDAVTIAGQSAGGGAVLTLLGVPRAAGLFHRAISISGAAGGLAVDEAETLGRRVAELGGVEPTRAGLSTLDEQTILGLQARATAPDGADGDPLAGIGQLISGGLTWSPVIDGDLLPQPVVDALRDGAGADKSLLLGATDQEFTGALTPFREQLATVPAAALLSSFGVPEATIGAYSAAHPDADTADLVGQFVTDTLFRAPALAVALARGQADAPTWLYRFAWRSGANGTASHCLDVPFWFDGLDLERVEDLAGANPPQSLADDVHGAAVSFIRTGEPGWAPVTSAVRTAHVFDTPSHDEAGAFADAEPVLAQRV